WPIDAIPTPDYDEYFAFLDEADFDVVFRRSVRMPFKTARGCWWGQKKQCTFCGIGSTAYQRKDADVALGEILGLVRKYRAMSLQCTDWIMAADYFDALLPKLAAERLDLDVFWEMKANVRRRHVRALRDARVMQIQPGIESLSTPLLELMRKGVTALANIRLL